MSRTLIVGIGSDHGDDRAGWLVADELQKQLVESSSIEVRKATVPLDLMDWLEDIDELQVCDASESTACGDGVLRFAWSGDTFMNGDQRVISVRGSSGSHGFGVWEVLQLAHSMGRLPKRVVIWAIRWKTFEANSELSPGTIESVCQVVERILNGLDVM